MLKFSSKVKRAVLIWIIYLTYHEQLQQQHQQKQQAFDP